VRGVRSVGGIDQRRNGPELQASRSSDLGLVRGCRAKAWDEPWDSSYPDSAIVGSPTRWLPSPSLCHFREMRPGLPLSRRVPRQKRPLSLGWKTQTQVVLRPHDASHPASGTEGGAKGSGLASLRAVITSSPGGGPDACRAGLTTHIARWHRSVGLRHPSQLKARPGSGSGVSPAL
jgi:hypothetical protein